MLLEFIMLKTVAFLLHVTIECYALDDSVLVHSAVKDTKFGDQKNDLNALRVNSELSKKSSSFGILRPCRPIKSHKKFRNFGRSLRPSVPSPINSPRGGCTESNVSQPDFDQTLRQVHSIKW